MLIQVGPNMVVNPEAIDLAYQPEGTEHTLVFINGQEYPQLAKVTYAEFVASLNRESRGFWKKFFRRS